MRWGGCYQRTDIGHELLNIHICTVLPKPNAVLPLDGPTPAIEGGRSVCPSTMGGSGLLVKFARSPGNHVVRAAAAGLGKLCNVCRHRCMGVTAWRESVAEWVGPIHCTERARIGATVQTCLCSWRGQPDHSTRHVPYAMSTMI